METDQIKFVSVLLASLEDHWFRYLGHCRRMLAGLPGAQRFRDRAALHRPVQVEDQMSPMPKGLRTNEEGKDTMRT